MSCLTPGKWVISKLLYWLEWHMQRIIPGRWVLSYAGEKTPRITPGRWALSYAGEKTPRIIPGRWVLSYWRRNTYQGLLLGDGPWVIGEETHTKDYSWEMGLELLEKKHIPRITPGRWALSHWRRNTYQG